MNYIGLDVPKGAYLFDTNGACTAAVLANIAATRWRPKGGSRYVSAPFVVNQGKCIKPWEPDVFTAARQVLLANYERFTRKDSQDSGNPNPKASWEILGSGVQDARWTIAQLEAIDYPRGWPVPFSCDDTPRGVADWQRMAAYWLDEAWPVIAGDGRWWWGAYQGGQTFRWMNAQPWDNRRKRLWLDAFKWQSWAWSYMTHVDGQTYPLIEDGTHVLQLYGDGEGGALPAVGVSWDLNVVQQRITPWGNRLPKLPPNPFPGEVPELPVQPAPGNITEETEMSARLCTFAYNRDDVYLAHNFNEANGTLSLVSAADMDTYTRWLPFGAPVVCEEGAEGSVVCLGPAGAGNRFRLVVDSVGAGPGQPGHDGAPGRDGAPGVAGVPGRDAVVDYGAVAAMFVNLVNKGLNR